MSPDKRKPKPAPKRSAEPLLTAAIHHFEEGNYAKAESLLRASLAGWLPTRLQRARAYKYLAFTYCVTDRVPQCREEFGQALRTDPRFTLTPGESGHPIWGPAFRSVSEGR